MPPDENLDVQSQPSPGGEDAKPEQQPSASSAPGSSDAAGESSTPEPVQPAESKPAEGGDKGVKKPKSVFEAAKAALDATRAREAATQRDKAGESPPPEEAGTQGADTKGATAEGDDGAAAKDYEPIKQPKTAAEKRLNELLTERKTYKPQAEHYQQLQEWIAGNQLTPELVTTSLGTAALAQRAQLSSDPEVAKQALEALEPVRQRLQAIAGVIETLPEDLQTKVNDGILNEADARDIAALRLRDKVSTEALRSNRERAEVQRQHDETSRTVHAVSSAINTWEQSVAKSDPDFSKKRSFVIAKLHELWAKEGPAREPGPAVDQAKRALEEVTKSMSGILPARREVNTQTTGSSPRNVGVQPKSSFEAAKARLRGQRISY